MERFPRGTLPPGAFAAVATLAPNAVARPQTAQTAQTAHVEPVKQCDLSTTCPSCATQMLPEHAHYRCPSCGYRDSCCF